MNSLFSKAEDYGKASAELIKTNRAQADSASLLLLHYELLKNKGVKATTEEKQDLITTTYKLRDALGDSVVSIDKETGALVLNQDAAKEAIKQKLLLANQEASTLALKVNVINEEKKGNRQTIDQLRAEINSRHDILEAVGLNAQQADGYYKLLLQGGNKAAAVEKDLSSTQLEAVRKYKEALRDMETKIERNVELEGNRLKILQELKKIGFSDKDVKQLFETTTKTVTETTTNDTGGGTPPVDPDVQKKLDDYKNKIKQLFDDLRNIKTAVVKEDAEREGLALNNKYQQEQEKAQQNLAEIEKTFGKESAQAIEYRKYTADYLLGLETKYRQDQQELVTKFNKQLADAEFAQDTANLKEWHDARKLAITQDYADEKITKEQFDAESRKLEAENLQYKLKIAKDYGKSVVEIEQMIAEGKIKSYEEDQKAFELAQHKKIAFNLQFALKGSLDELNAKKAALREQYDLDVANAKKTGEDINKINKYYQNEQDQLDIEFAKKKVDQIAQVYQQLASIANSFAQLQANINAKELQRDKKSNDIQKANLKDQLDHKKISQEEYNSQVAAIDKEYNDKRIRLQKEAFRNKKIADTIQAVINTAVAVTEALTAGPYVGEVLAVLAAAAGAAQIAVIQSQPEPEYAKGKREGFIARGASHAEGGIALIDSKSGRKVGEMEGDEAIIPAETSRKNAAVIDALLQGTVFPEDPVDARNLVSHTVFGRGKYPGEGDARNLVSNTVYAAGKYPDFSPRFITPSNRSLNTQQVIEQIQVQRFGYVSSSSAPPLTPKGEAARDVTNLEILKVLKQHDESLQRLNKNLENPKPTQAFLNYNRFKEDLARVEQAKSNASIGK